MNWLFCLIAACIGSSLSAQNPDWETHTFEYYKIQFQTPKHWQININTSNQKSFIECSSPDNGIYFFLTVAENEKKSEPDIILSYLKVTYSNAEFIRDETQSINGINFIFSVGINTLNESSSYIRIGVGKHKDMIYMVDSGFNAVNSEADESTLNRVIASLKPIR